MMKDPARSVKAVLLPRVMAAKPVVRTPVEERAFISDRMEESRRKDGSRSW